MRARIIIAAVVAALAVALPATASASWTITQRQAESYARQSAHQEYQVNRYRAGALCSPKGTSQSDQPRWPGYYHSWVCGWAISYEANGICGGRISIKGTTSSVYAFRYVVLNGMRCDL